MNANLSRLVHLMQEYHVRFSPMAINHVLDTRSIISLNRSPSRQAFTLTHLCLSSTAGHADHTLSLSLFFYLFKKLQQAILDLLKGVVPKKRLLCCQNAVLFSFYLPVAQLVQLPHLRGRLVQQSVPPCKHIQVRAVTTTHIASHRDARSQAGVQNLSHPIHIAIRVCHKGGTACMPAKVHI